jgi:hypothetical protein
MNVFRGAPSAAKGHFPFPTGVCSDVETLSLIPDKNVGRDFDEWWNRILSAVLTGLTQPDAPMGDSFRNRQSLETEIWLREQFRQELLASDWNHLEQCIHACTLPFDGWISTNYTHFADRAIHAVGTRGENSAPSWFTAASGSEAMRLLSDFMHSETESGKRRASDPSRWLFKIHGDIARFDTMTLAGLDKEAGSPFYVRLDALHPLYLAARAYVADRLRRKTDAKLVLHVVGHALRDSMLNRLLADIVIDARRSDRAVEWRRADWNVKVANCPMSEALARGIRTDQLSAIQSVEKERGRDDFRGYRTTAARYLASWRRVLMTPADPRESPKARAERENRLLLNFVNLDRRDVES